MVDFPFAMEPLLEQALEAARLAGKELSDRFGRVVETRMKGVDDPVTEADYAATAVLEKQLLRGPVTEWLCEESPAVPQTPVYWAVDPMDGTKSFLNHEPDFTVSIGLVVDKKVVLGVIYNPITRETYFAIRGQGLQVIDAVRKPLESVPLASAKMLLSRTELGRGQLEPLPAAIGEVVAVGSIAYKLALIAAGAAHATMSRTHKSIWDVAAGSLLIEEAGGRVTDFHGEPLDARAKERQGVIAAAPGLYGELRGWLHERALDRVV